VKDEAIRVIIADDHPVYRDGLARLLDDLEGIDIVGLAADGQQVVQMAASLAPDVIVMDLRMPTMDGVEATRQITLASPHIGVVVLSMFDEDDLVFAAVRAGARGYLLKDADEDEIARVIFGVGRGEAIFGPSTAQRILAMVSRTNQTEPKAQEFPFPQLTEREREVLVLLARGQRNADIANDLFLSERTVRNYVSNIFTKLQVADRASAIAAARDVGVGNPSIDDV
jgi:DNA-binding NarL/FixJ family response regulator